MAKVDWHGHELLARTRAAVRPAMHRTGLRVEARAKENTRRDFHKTGHAMRSIHTIVQETPATVTVQTGSNVDYFKWGEIGTRGRPGHAMLGKAMNGVETDLQHELARLG